MGTRGPKPEDWKTRLMRKVKRSERGCLLWQGSLTYGGYGRFDSRRTAHRVSWELANGAIPTGKLVLHRCDTPACVNPQHLFLGTPSDNAIDMMKKGRSCVGRAHWNARLTEEKVEHMKKVYAAGGVSFVRLGRMFGVGRSQAHRVVRGLRWGSN